MALIHVLDARNARVIGTLDSDAGDFTQARVTRSTNQAYTFDFTAHRKLDLLQGMNRIVIKGVGDVWEEYTIRTREDYGGEVLIEADGSFVEDLRKAAPHAPEKLQGETPLTALRQALSPSNIWQPGRAEWSGEVRDLTLTDYSDPYEFILKIAEEFGMDLRFRVEISDNIVAGRYVDLLEDPDPYMGREIEFGRNLIGVRRLEDSQNLVSALVVVGPDPDEEGASPIVVTVEDQDARDRWGMDGQHLWAVYKPEMADENPTAFQLSRAGADELKRRINALVQYEVDALSYPDMKIGATIRIKDTSYEPPLYLEAIVREQEEDLIRGDVVSFKLGDFIQFTEAELLAQVKEIRDLLKKAALRTEIERDLALIVEDLEGKEPSILVSPDPPPAPYPGLKWMDSSRLPHVLKVYNGTAWEKATPTEAAEVGAETPGGAQDKADQAERDAKEHADGAADYAEQNAKDYADLKDQQWVLDVKNANSDFVQEYANRKIQQSATAPTAPEEDDLWIDTSETPHVWKRWDGTAWVNASAVALEDLKGELDGARIAVRSIEGPKIADLTISSGKILDGAINDAKIAAGAVTEGGLQNGAVTTGKLAEKAITSAKLALEAVQAGHIQIGAVEGPAIADFAITDEKIKELDASKVQTGLLNDQRIKIGPGSTYVIGYDPTTKETPSGAQNKADTAERTAKTYAEGQATTAEQSAVQKAATDAQTKANAARDSAVASAATDATAKAGAAETAAKTYAEQQDQAALLEAAATAQEKADAARQAAELAAQGMAEAEAEAARLAAIADADGKITAEEQARIKEAQENLAAAKLDATNKADAAKQAAIDAAALDAQAKANAAQQAAEAVAVAEADAAETAAKAHADGKITAEEQARINQAAANLETAKADATSKANAAQQAAIEAAALDATAKASAAQLAAEQAAQTAAEAEAEAARLAAIADADGKINAEEQARIKQAQENLAAAKLDATNKADAAKKAAIDAAALDAQAKANAAQQAAEAAAATLAEAEAEAARLAAIADADGKIDAEEQERIRQAAANLEAAKADATTKANNAKTAAINAAALDATAKANAAQTAAEQAAATLAAAEADAAETAAKAHADGIVTTEEQARIQQAADNLAAAKKDATTKANAAEAAAIKAAALDAQTKANAAQQAAEAAAATLAQAEAEAAQAAAIAEAGRQITAEEQARIQQAQANLEAAQLDAANKAAAAEKAAKLHAETQAEAARASAVSTAATDATNKASGAESRAKSHADTAASTAKQEAITAADLAAAAKASAAQTAAIQAAATDATEKAGAAETAAKTFATGEANTAKTTAISTAATDATKKAGDAQAAAISTAASDATSKASGAESRAKSHADSAASTAKSQAISAAATDAASKASAAQSAAVSTAATDAANKAEAAKNTAISTAASDATKKAGDAETAAKAHADTKAGAAETAAKTYAAEQDETVKTYVQSRGENLVTNGTGLLGDNTNFPAAEYDGSQQVAGFGSFRITGAKTLTTSEMIPVDPSKIYRMNFFAKSSVPSRLYYGLNMYDQDGHLMSAHDQQFYKGTLTELAQDLNPGDEYIYLKDMSKWYTTNIPHGNQGRQYSIMWWDYRSEKGFLYPPETYSRNWDNYIFDAAGMDFANNRIKLLKPWSGPFKPVNTPLSQRTFGGGSMTYFASNVPVDTEFRKYTGEITTVQAYVGRNSGITFIPYVAGVRLAWLINYSGLKDTETWLNGVEFKDVSEEVNAKSYATEQAGAAESAAKTFATKEAGDAEEAAKSHADTAASTAETRAKSHADTEAAASLKAAKEYRDLWAYPGTTYIDGGDLYNNSVTTNALAAKSVTAAEIAALAVTANHIAAKAITAEKMAANSITAANAAIANAAIVTANIQDAAITNAKIGSLDAAKITTGVLNAARVQIGAGTTFAAGYNPSEKATVAQAQAAAEAAAAGEVRPVSDRIALWQYADTAYIDGGNIYANSITANQIAAGSITSDLIAANQITASLIAAKAVQAGKLDVNAVTAGTIAADAITAREIAADAVTAEQIAANSITSSMISTAGLDAGVIKFGTMSGDRILANTLDASKLKAGTVIAGDITFKGKLEGANGTFHGMLESVGDNPEGGQDYVTIANGFIGFSNNNFAQSGGYMSIDPDGFRIRAGATSFSLGYLWLEASTVDVSTYMSVGASLSVAEGITAGGHSQLNGGLTTSYLDVTGTVWMGSTLYVGNKATVDSLDVGAGDFTVSAAGSVSMRNGSALNLGGTSSKLYFGDSNDYYQIKSNSHYFYNNTNYFRIFPSSSTYTDIYTNASWVDFVNTGVSAREFRLGTNSMLTMGQSYHSSSAQYNGEVYSMNELWLRSRGTTLRLDDTVAALLVRTGDDQLYAEAKALKFTVMSDRKAKKDFEVFNAPASAPAALAAVKKTPVWRYRFINEEGTADKSLGLVADEAPAEIVDPDGEGIDVYAMTALLWKAVQELDGRLDAIEGLSSLSHGKTLTEAIATEPLQNLISGLQSINQNKGRNKK